MMKPPTPTTTPIIVFLVLLLSPPPEEEPLSVREAELDGEAEELVGEEDVEESLLVLDGEVVGGVVVVAGGVVEDCEGLEVGLELELDEDEEGVVVVCAVLEVELELLLEGVVVGGVVEDVGVDVSEVELVGVEDVLLAESVEELLSVGSFPFKTESSPERPLSWRPRIFGIAIVAWVTAMAARTATSDCARKSMMRMLMDR